MTEYGDRYPLGETFKDPRKYDTPAEVGILARTTADALLSEPALDLHCTEMHMRALAGLFNGFGNLDEQTFNRLSPVARTTVHRAAQAANEYFDERGYGDKQHHELELLYPNGASQRDWDAYFINVMQLHVSVAAMAEDRRRGHLVYKGFVSPGDSAYQYLKEQGFTNENPDIAKMDRASGELPYSEVGIRKVLNVFGDSVGPLIVSFHEVAPLNVDGRTIVHHAASSLKAAFKLPRQ